MKRRRIWLQGLFLALILLLAASLRFYRLDGQSLWADEGNSAALALRTLPTITRDAAHDIHPPLYYYVLHFWVRSFGNSEIALRSLSALAGTILVGVVYVLGRDLFSIRTALIATFVAAISPLQVHYCQETRMYILVALWSALAVLFFVKWIKQQGVSVDPDQGAHPHRTRSAPALIFMSLYVCLTAAALYTHYFAFTVPLVTNLAYVLGIVVHRPLRRLRAVGTWVGAQLVIVALYLPWLRLAGGQLATWPAVSEPLSLRFLVADLLRVLSLGLSVEPQLTPVVLAFGLLLLLGALPWAIWSRNSKTPGFLPRPELEALVFTLLFLCVPVLAMYVLSLSRPAYDPKFLLLITPAYSLLLARGIGAAWLGDPDGHSLRVAGGWAFTAILLVFVGAASAPSLTNYYFDDRYERDDYRGIVRYISAVGQEKDAIILNAPGQIDIFSYYYQGELRVYPLPGQRPADRAKTEEALERIVDQHRRLYVLFWGTEESDPGRFVEGWLDQNTFKALDSWRGNVRLAIYSAPQEEIGQEIKHPVTATFGDDIALLGYSLSGSQVQAGDILQLALFWQANDEITQRYKVFAQVLDGRSNIVGQRDSEPVGGSRPTTTWEEGEIIADHHGVLILPGTPPGEHRLEIGLYSLESGQRLIVSTNGEEIGDHLLLEPIQILKADVPPALEALGMQHRHQMDFGPVRLLGYNVSKLGYEHLPEEPVGPGDTVHLTLFWQAVDEMNAEFALKFRLEDRRGNVALSREVQPAGGAYPPTVWDPGEIVRDQHNLRLPDSLASGEQILLLSVSGQSVRGAAFSLVTLSF
jgi:mannosyltransferase